MKRQRSATAAAKYKLKLWYRRLNGAWQRWRYAFSRLDLETALRGIGVAPGDLLFVHSSFGAFAGFEGNPLDVVHLLQDLVGKQGTILMPTQAYQSTAVDYVRSGKLFKVDRSPSHMGLITEIFRRSAGVVRSSHPTHPVAAWGALAGELIADHRLAATPCGRGTPFARLMDRDGKILFLGAPIRTMTFVHAVDELLEDRLPASPFTTERFEIEFIDRDGKPATTAPQRLFDPYWSKLRHLERLEPHFREAGILHEARVGRLDLILVSARSVAETLGDLLTRGIYFYDFERGLSEKPSEPVD